MIEYLSGDLLVSKWEDLPLQENEALVGEIAKIFKVVQDIDLPAGVDSYGPLTIIDGNIVSGEHFEYHGGPLKTNTEWWTARFNENLTNASTSSLLNGWQANGLRARVENFINEKVPAIASVLDSTKPTLIHSDLGNVPPYCSIGCLLTVQSTHKSAI
jgi:hypothetical protein